MRCADIMKTDIECVSPEVSVREAARKMRDQNIGFLPVCDESMHAVGAITDRDIAVRAVADGLSGNVDVQQILTPEVIACRPDDDVKHARELMMSHRKSRIMCVGKSGRLEGVISLSDIADLDERGGARALREISARERRRPDGPWALPI